MKPLSKGKQPSKAVSADALLEQAILLRREVPGRSVAQIIRILEWEGRIQPGEIKRSTMQEKLTERGYSSRHMRMYADSSVASRRFQQKHRNRLWHSDIKYGPYLPIGPNGSMKQVFLVTFVDDATRYVLHGEFYPVMDKSIVEDCFRRAIQKNGVPESVYFDNGKQYRTKWMTRACSKLGIKLLFAKPFSPEATGKVERFNRVVDSFLSEAVLEKPKTLERLNELFQVWLSECYQHKSHSALPGKQSPETSFRSDKKALRFVDPDLLTNAFLQCESRKVDKSGCISFMDRKYEVGLLFISRTVEVIFDPADISELTIEYEDHKPWQVRELVIGERAGKRPALPTQRQRESAESSRMLDAAESRHQVRNERQAPAVSYRAVWKETDHV
ncbi:MAG: transposase [Paenibacillus sp.]|nr:transposase [Paenibacillus sp.]